VKSLLHEISGACPVVAENARALLQLDPLEVENNAAVDALLAPIRAAVSDRKVALGMWEDRERETFAGRLRRLRAEKGWSQRGFERECRKAAQ
jgi:hypothetical protein